MADSATQVQAVAALLGEWGHTVIEVDGWENRGSGNLTTGGRLEHHTAGARSGDTPSLRVVTFGRAGLRNSLCRWYVSRSGVIYLVARKASWHAGRGGKGSNSTLSGTEAENSGTGEAWTPRSLEAQAAISAAECRVFGISPNRIYDHKEHAPSRKVDRYGIDPAQWRGRVAALVSAGHAPPPEDEMALVDENVQRKLQRMGEAGILDDFMRLHADFFGKHRGSPTSMGHLLRFYRGVRDRIPRDDPQDVGRQVAYGAVQGNRLREVTDEQGSTIRGVVEGAIGLIRSHRAEPDQDVLD